MAVNRYDDTRAWYAISTYSGYEDKVADSIKQMTPLILKTKSSTPSSPKKNKSKLKTVSAKSSTAKFSKATYS